MAVPQGAEHGRALGARHFVDRALRKIGRMEPEGVPPLLRGALGVAPGRRVAGDDLLDRVHDRGEPPSPPSGISAFANEADVLQSFRAGGGERNRRVLADADVGLAPVDENVLLGT